MSLPPPPPPPPSELDSTLVQVVAPSQLHPPPTAPVPSFQDIDSDSPSEDDEQDWDAVVAAAEAAFTDEEREGIHDYLRERGLFAFVKRFVQDMNMPVPKLLLAFGVMVPPQIDSLSDQLRLLKLTCSRVLRNRFKLEEYNTVSDAVELIRRSKRILILTGAGVSTSCGIPDFRSPDGLYARLKDEHWDLDDPQQMFDLPYFKEKPNVFYSFAKEIYPSNFVPSPCHHFVKLLETNGQLLRNYTQNIDGLFESIGVQCMLNCHGSFATASCLTCRTRFPGSAIEADVFASRVPLCPVCTAKQEQAAKLTPPAPPPKKSPTKWTEGEDEDESDGDGMAPNEWEGKPLVKPDIVFFGEMLSDEFDRGLLADREEVDLLIVIGTSLRVSPVSQLPAHLPHSIPQLLINRDPIPHQNFDICLLGDGDTIVRHLCAKLQDQDGVDEGHWRLPAPGQRTLNNEADAEVGRAEEQAARDVVPERVADSHVWLFPGSNPDGRWVQAVRKAYEEGSEDDGEEGKSEVHDSEEVQDGLRAPGLLHDGSGSGASGGRSRERSEDVELGREEEGKRLRVE